MFSFFVPAITSRSMITLSEEQPKPTINTDVGWEGFGLAVRSRELVETIHGKLGRDTG